MKEVDVSVKRWGTVFRAALSKGKLFGSFLDENGFTAALLVNISI